MAKVSVSVPKKVTRKKTATKKAAKKTAKKASKKVAKKTTRKRAAKSEVVAPKAVTARMPVGSSFAQGKGLKVGKYAMNGLPWVLAAGFASLLFFKTRESAGAQAPLAPLPGLEPVPPSPSPAPAPKPSAPDLSAQERVDVDFRRAKVAEIPRDILQKAKQHTKEPIGAIIFATSSVNGKEYAFVLEQHSNLPKGDGGVSVFIHR